MIDTIWQPRKKVHVLSDSAFFRQTTTIAVRLTILGQEQRSMNTSRFALISSIRFVVMICVLCLTFQAQLIVAQSSNITVQVDKPGGDISPTMFGVFFEDINFGADGWLYPERVKNRSFEFPEPLMAWKQIGRGDSKGTVTVLDENPINANNSHYLHIEVEKPGNGFGAMNEGFRGIGVQRGAAYAFSLYARNVEHTQRAGNTRRVERNPVALRVELEDESGRILGKGRLVGLTPTWKKYSITLVPSATGLKAHLN